MDEILYKDDKFILIKEDTGLIKLYTQNTKYEINYIEINNTIIIKGSDSTNLILKISLNLNSLINNFKKRKNINDIIYTNLTKLEFCEMINLLILRSKYLKQKNNKNEIEISFSELCKYYKGYFIYTETPENSWETKLYIAIKFSETGEIYNKIEGDLYWCNSIESIKETIDEQLKYIHTIITINNKKYFINNYYNGYYYLIEINDDLNETQINKLNFENRSADEIVKMIKCPNCKKENWITETTISIFKKNKINCKQCNLLLTK